MVAGRFFLLIAFLFLLGFQSAAQPVAPTPGESSCVKISVPPRFFVGEPVEALLTVTNTTTKPLGFNSGSIFTVWAKAEDGSLFSNGLISCGPTFILQPGQTHRARYGLAWLARKRLGKYVIMASADAYPFPDGTHPSGLSAEATIQIEEPTGIDADALRWRRLIEERTGYSAEYLLPRLFPTSRYSTYARYNEAEFFFVALCRTRINKAVFARGTFPRRAVPLYRAVASGTASDPSLRDKALLREMQWLYLSGDLSPRARLLSRALSQGESHTAYEARAFLSNWVVSCFFARAAQVKNAVFDRPFLDAQTILSRAFFDEQR